MRNKRNQVISIARFLAYKSDLKFKMENMTEDEYLNNPIGLDVGQYIDDMLKYCPEQTVDSVLKYQNEMISRLGMEYLVVVAFMTYVGGGESNAG
ncbi:hypothetical protein DesLBE_3673 [Desulfitobacterium sp. LBE]|uniref:hypothetical protein n=1 Tax=Desulfitobacterium sp. LBE TaxID=884086 RepID=UPI00119C7EFF|nr:hypothetical protein [Desulfitobacterium sp. LBE]TWH59298.1 hypothetical protein DesLBE_3673 [Desulfitobacterium sp. LBE]